MEIDKELPNKETRERILYDEDLHETPRKSFLDLNDDCWIVICDWLSYQDLLNLSKVSSAYKEFVGNCLLPFKVTKWEITFSKKRECMNLEDFDYIIKSIHLTVKQLHLYSLPVTYFEALKSYCFTCVTEAHVTTDHYMKAADNAALTSMFPNLRTFSPHGLCASATIVLFRHLENLTLTYCRNFSVKDFRRVLVALHLKSLTLDIFKPNTLRHSRLNALESPHLSKIEHITLNCSELDWLCFSDRNNTVSFQNLKVLVLKGHILGKKTVDKFFRNIQSLVPHNPYEIEMSNVSYDLLCKIMVPEKNTFLKSVKILKFIHVSIRLDVFGVPCRYRDLRELYFLYCYAEFSEEVLTILSNSKHLDVLSFEKCHTPYIILYEDFLKETLRRREKPLTLNWYSEQNDLEVHWGNQPQDMLKCTKEPHVASKLDDSMTILFK
ncbi:uncharacterized protein LOC129253023 [Anastrepha obliqua]|uniref:uncharacterized protein LOC129253023 n=1 Tax=Anastrepha obliqua TaxID=95512 RepID=UPI00240A1F2A|nr:uncharacterized protein LOC129253023 [Anastrepha obliqua]